MAAEKISTEIVEEDKKLVHIKMGHASCPIVGIIQFYIILTLQDRVLESA